MAGKEIFCHEGIFFGFKTASAVNELTAGGGEASGVFKDIALKFYNGGQIFF